MNVHFREVLPGKGVMDYTTFLKRLSQLPSRPPLMVEHLSNAQEYAAARDFILATGRKAGVKFTHQID
jgi:L-ribulose-5-phosphate 3-epimerase UlaE